MGLKRPLRGSTCTLRVRDSRSTSGLKGVGAYLWAVKEDGVAYRELRKQGVLVGRPLGTWPCYVIRDL